MTFKFDYPVHLPRFTSDEFERLRDAYVARHGYRIHIPGFEDIFHWGQPPEPTREELRAYRRQDFNVLSHERYDQIKELKQKRKDKFERLISSPSNRIMRNAASILTSLDDLNDTLGTLGCVARFAARRLPASIAKLATGPAGWLFTAAEVTNIATDLSRRPFKAMRIQHMLNNTIKNQPLLKKAKLRRLNKLKRLHLSKGELIEALQTTDSMFGVGLSLGPIFGLLWDVPAGLYRHVRGETVTVTGLPTPLLWFDRVWTRFLKSSASLWTGIPEIDDRELGQTMAAQNICTQVMQSALRDASVCDMVSQFQGLEIIAPTPEKPLTLEILQEAGIDPEDYTGSTVTGRNTYSPTEIWELAREDVLQNIKDWQQRTKHDQEAMVASQNAVEASTNMLGLLEGIDAVEWTYAAVPHTILKLMNQNLRFPPDATPAQAKCWYSKVAKYDEWALEPDTATAQSIAKDECGFEFTTEIEGRAWYLEEKRKADAKKTQARWREYHFSQWATWLRRFCFKARPRGIYTQELCARNAYKHSRWLYYNDWPADQPDKHIKAQPHSQPQYLLECIGNIYENLDFLKKETVEELSSLYFLRYQTTYYSYCTWEPGKFPQTKATYETYLNHYERWFKQFGYPKGEPGNFADQISSAHPELIQKCDRKLT